jgi:hypothetical protein
MEFMNTKGNGTETTALKKVLMECRRQKFRKLGTPNLVIEIPTRVFDNLKKISSKLRRKLVRSNDSRSMKSTSPREECNSRSINGQCSRVSQDSIAPDDGHLSFGSLDSFDRSQIMAMSDEFKESKNPYNVPVISDYENTTDDDEEETVNGTISSYASEEGYPIYGGRYIYVDTAGHPDFSKSLNDSLSYSTDGSLDESDIMYHVNKWRLLPSKLFDDSTAVEEDILMQPLPLFGSQEVLNIELCHRQQ